MKQYCQGHTNVDTIAGKCQNCQYLDNTKTLEQFPDALKRRLLGDMTEIDSQECLSHHYRYFIFVPF